MQVVQFYPGSAKTSNTININQFRISKICLCSALYFCLKSVLHVYSSGNASYMFNCHQKSFLPSCLPWFINASMATNMFANVKPDHHGGDADVRRVRKWIWYCFIPLLHSLNVDLLSIAGVKTLLTWQSYEIWYKFPTLLTEMISPKLANCLNIPDGSAIIKSNMNSTRLYAEWKTSWAHLDSRNENQMTTILLLFRIDKEKRDHGLQCSYPISC